MSLGGGVYTIENKVLPGAYINFVTTKRGNVEFGERGVGALGLNLDWGELITIVEKENIRQDCKKLFGYDYDSYEMLPIREFFRHANKLIAYRLNRDGAKASCDFASAKKSGKRGNDITIVVLKNVDDTTMFDVETYIDNELVDTQTVDSAKSLVNSEYIIWSVSAGLETGTYKLSGGTNGTTSGNSIANFCNVMEDYRFNAIAAVVEDAEADQVMIEYTKRLREEKGIKFQCVTMSAHGDYEGVVTIYNNDTNDGNDPWNIMAWVCGALAGCQINESLTNMLYDGEIDIATTDSNSSLERIIKLGYFAFHKVDGEIRVLKDINSLRTLTENKGSALQNNQTIRVCDQIATDVASLFANYYIGKVPNDKAGRNSLWSELVKYHESLQSIRAIEDFDEEDIEVLQGEDKTSVVINESIIPVNAMDKLYMKVYIE